VSDMNPTKGQALILFSPAIILVVWAFVLSSQHGYIDARWAFFFLVVLAIAVASAEYVRMRLRKALQEKIRERDRSVDERS